MIERESFPLDAVADRFRRAARAEPQWSDPGDGTWDAIAAATGVAAAPGPPTPPEPASAPSVGIGRREWLFGLGGVLLGAAAGATGMWASGGAAELGDAVRRAVLTPLDRPDEELGRAELLRRSAGYSLAVEVPGGVNNPNGYVEVWLINIDLARMISVGVFAADEVGRFTIDPSLIESGYLIVDLSNELFDDEPRHSGDTIMRGELQL
ncbi:MULTISPECIES: anti-sigma factor [unclassified Tessaracoccus]|uniref:anti-sigma factor n=1 Tax=unclassified Tessaracoccus TaxID=2635419 RepID=UPI001603CC8E|nr:MULTISPECIES: anti-sigma factor [unclassified Tessaracoccus]MBB1511903.1 anti-sigma factor [Tessaracoccus sp. MC1627]MBB1514410.1 anti-sigma factor [Tessaracoccus sp. MC1679]